jgi:peptidoglycan-N-acetylglucosamine deacetylase
MLISIVIPAKNEERYLADCLKSMKAQSYQGDYEIILVDNGSKDNTAAVARSFGVKVVSAPEQKGVAHARQTGADAANGDIIVQADADTIYPLDWLQRLSDDLSAHPKASAISGRFFYREKFRWAFIELFIRNIINIVHTWIYGRPLLVSGATFGFRRDVFYAAGGYHGLTYSADQYGLTRRLRKYGRILYDPDLFVYTSSRTVKKPWPILLRDVGRNIVVMAAYAMGLIFASPTPERRRKMRKAFAWSLSSIAAFIIAFCSYGYFVPAAPVFGKVYSQGPHDEKVIAITFDDGPNEPYTSQILDILKENEVPATFFLIGENAELYPDTARRILAEGHAIGNHSYSHDPNHALNDYKSQDIVKAENAIYGVTGVRPHLYRPPNGKKTPWEIFNLDKADMVAVTWNLTVNDQHVFAYFGKPNAESYAKQMISNARPGSIILMHDGYGLIHNCSQADKSLAVEALPIIIAGLKANGYRFVTVPELLDVPAYN